MKNLITLMMASWAPVALAGEIVTLQDGRDVQLNDDFTWQYVQPVETSNSMSVAPAKPEVVAAAPVLAAPLVKAQRGSMIELGSTKPTLQLSNSGVDIVLGSARYRDGQLILPTAITNQSTQSVINIVLQVEILDEQGNLLTTQTTTIWQSIKRMADTYLRPQASVAGKAIEVKVDEAPRYQIRASVTQVESR
ncbi:DUF3157 family protein [Vibrio fluvialis]|uniref:DUF3157 domain-containing protein n=1 Tax=Vibrio fluvialis TaxID=676 RepID=A0AAX2LUW5_VIBFL|nr:MULTISPECIES: DUF3157 family protein [Vibrio]HDM8036349.1 DUF3157 family protein [Vibrio fluvialis clinical-1]AMF95662.1 DUF3157 domain-containing protein [Vibrio fluvialis]EKO3370048.1 DUF3157 family protein [Vibrio fluvialis]EKO3396017.1 DUF3157 family protein [Vibrio fluvialis]EKO3401061.1 DUF3157 family protein [Vibrio fluvialis]